MANLRGLDLNLMTVFEAVYECGSITRAAERLALSQSATSHAVARLRETCRDDLFVRVGQGIVPTPVAQRIYPDIRRALDGMRRAVAEARGFDPATTSRRFCISIPHPAGPLWALAIQHRARLAAPGVTIAFDTRTMPADLPDKLRSGEIDIAVDWLVPTDGRFVTRKIFLDELVFIARRGHPRVSADGQLDDLHTSEFVLVQRRSRQVPDYIEEFWDRIREFDIAIRLLVNEALEVPYLVLQTNLIGLVPRSIVNDLAADVGFRIVTLPMDPMPEPIYSVWHETRRTDPGHEWLRALVADTVSANRAP